MRFPQWLNTIFRWVNESPWHMFLFVMGAVFFDSLVAVLFGVVGTEVVAVLVLLFIAGLIIYRNPRLGTDEDPYYSRNRDRGML